jgi:hypothetical protein
MGLLKLKPKSASRQVDARELDFDGGTVMVWRFPTYLRVTIHNASGEESFELRQNEVSPVMALISEMV